MVTNVAMLRGVNVGARNKIKMTELAALFAGLGHTNVVTYIQSGNVVFNSRSKSSAAIVRGIEERIGQELGLDVKVLLRTHDELAAAVRSNPFLRSGADVSKLHVSFLAEKPAAAVVRAIAGSDFAPDEFRVVGREVYVYCPGGYGNTKINNGFFEKRLKATATTRNWNSVNKLLELATA
jgi:uncharacterized protein (DUF1697 family)